MGRTLRSKQSRICKKLQVQNGAGNRTPGTLAHEHISAQHEASCPL